VDEVAAEDATTCAEENMGMPGDGAALLLRLRAMGSRVARLEMPEYAAASSLCGSSVGVWLWCRFSAFPCPPPPPPIMLEYLRSEISRNNQNMISHHI
jgi:hypothetical protein